MYHHFHWKCNLVCGQKTKYGRKKVRGYPDLNRGPLDLQSNALPLSYTPTVMKRTEINYSYWLTHAIACSFASFPRTRPSSLSLIDGCGFLWEPSHSRLCVQAKVVMVIVLSFCRALVLQGGVTPIDSIVTAATALVNWSTCIIRKGWSRYTFFRVLP